MDIALVHLCVAQGLFNRLHALAEEVHVQLLKTGTGDGGVELHALIPAGPGVVRLSLWAWQR